MEFTAGLTTAEKLAACEAAADQIEPSVYEKILLLGFDPTTFDGDNYAIPAGKEDAEVYAIEHTLKERLAALATLKAHKASLS